jgi:hypothetical protein
VRRSGLGIVERVLLAVIVAALAIVLGIAFHPLLFLILVIALVVFVI